MTCAGFITLTGNMVCNQWLDMLGGGGGTRISHGFVSGIDTYTKIVKSSCQYHVFNKNAEKIL